MRSSNKLMLLLAALLAVLVMGVGGYLILRETGVADAVGVSASGESSSQPIPDREDADPSIGASVVKAPAEGAASDGSATQAANLPGEGGTAGGTATVRTGTNELARVAGGSTSNDGTATRDDDKPTGTTEPTPEAPVYTLRGRVTDNDGEPVEGIEVTFQQNTRDDPATPLSAITDKDGVYTIAGASGMSITVSARTPPGFPVSLVQAKTMHVENSPDPLVVDFRLDLGGSIDGIVLNEDGRPIEGAVISRGGLGMRETSDAEGHFILRYIPERGGVQVTVSHPDYQSETRPNVTLFDGTQTFVLSRSNDLVLKVTWGFDGSPVQQFAYRLLRQHVTGQFRDIDRKEVAVNSPQGTVTLLNVESGQWRAEVTVLAPDGSPTDIRGAHEFELTAGMKGEIPVVITAGRRITGTVMMDEPRIAVPRALVKFLAPSRGFGQPPDPAPVFNIPDVYTNYTGGFAVEGVPPGRYSLTAEQEPLLTLKPIDIDVAYKEDPPPLTITMSSGGRIYGKVIESAAGGAVLGYALSISRQNPNADGWSYASATVNADGTYESPGLPVGTHYLWLSRNGQSLTSRLVDLGPGEKKEVNFDLTGHINVIGRITSNGQPVASRSGEERYHFASPDSGPGPGLQVAVDGRYATTLSPGTYFFFNGGSQIQKIEVLPSPPQQTFDFDIGSADVDIVLVFPSDADFAPGNLVLSPPERALRYNFYRQQMAQDRKRLPNVPPGQWQATFTTRDGAWIGASDWIEVKRGEENVVVLEVKRVAETIRIGGWAPGEISNTEYTTLSFPLPSADFASSTELSITCLYQRGRHAVSLNGVRLVSGGRTIAEDMHSGWTGADHWNNVYRLRGFAASALPSATVQVDLKGDGGNDTAGSVYLTIRRGGGAP